MEETQVPEMSLSDNKIVLATKEIPLKVNGTEVMIKMQKLTAGGKQEIIKKAAATKYIGQQVQANIDAIGYQIGLLSKVIIDAPFPTTEPEIAKLPETILDYLFEQYNQWDKPKKKD